MQQELLIKAGVKYKISHIMVALRENAFFLTFVFTLEMQFFRQFHTPCFLPGKKMSPYSTESTDLKYLPPSHNLIAVYSCMEGTSLCYNRDAHNAINKYISFM